MMCAVDCRGAKKLRVLGVVAGRGQDRGSFVDDTRKGGEIMFCGGVGRRRS